ncbi:prophage regulatory protein [Cupriavidus metallidurans]|jgi:prophage regulatory protein|uniref:helix-turn-helix transcriptional regulator n=1 Tax=Cupriavidus TaxID=106589 RepID=UPI00049300F8|nr:AlpA family transcriptional regulator [Cupriavidus metallidurans]KWW37556.1 hypothetical protein AU374_01321 [Cupriavidus metallidurans]MDE4918704.1 AlpA family transcriptional regulator [Cupriavidus metallidurans]
MHSDTAKRKVLRARDIAEMTGLARPTIYYYVKLGQFPKPIPLGAKAVGWLASEVEAWLDARIQARK